MRLVCFLLAHLFNHTGWMHAGYPIMAFTAAAHELVNVDSMRRGMWGPIHELGHNQQRRCWEFPPHTTEGTCNLWSVYVHEEVLGIDRAQVKFLLKNNDLVINQHTITPVLFA